MRENRPMFKRLTATFLAIVWPMAVTGAPVDVALSRQCALDICGEPRTFLNVSEMIESKKVVDPTISQEFNQTVKPLLDTWVSSSLENVKAQLQASVSGITELMKTPLTPNEVAINNLVWALGHEQLNSLLAIASNVNGRTVIDRAQAPKVLGGLRSSEQGYLIDYAEAIINVPEYRELHFLAIATYANLLATKYPYLTLKFAAQADGRHFLNIQKYLVSIDPNLNFLSWITQQNFINLAEGNEVVLNPDTQWRIAKARLNLALYHQVLNPGPTHDLFLKRPITYDAAQLQAKINGVVSRVQALVSDEHKLQIQKNKLMDACLKSFNFSVRAAPSDAELQNIQTKIKAVKSASQNVAVELTEADLVNSLSRSIQNAEFLLPNTSDQVTPMWLRSIRAMMASDQQDATARTLPQWFTRYGVDIVDEIADDAIFYSISNLCSSLQPSGPSDHALTTLGKISLSWPTVKYPEFGVGVIAHELGHLVSTAMGRTSSSQFRQIRQCTVMRHLSPSNPSFVGNMNYVEEDWADTFAAQVLRGISSRKNFACIFLAKDGSTYGSEEQPLSLENSNRSDTHSADFFRAIQFQLELGSLPASCRQVVTSTGHSFFNRCGK